MKKFGYIPEDKLKDKTVTFRMPLENYKLLLRLDANVSTTLRYLIERYLEELSNSDEKYTSWNKKA